MTKPTRKTALARIFQQLIVLLCCLSVAYALQAAEVELPAKKPAVTAPVSLPETPKRQMRRFAFVLDVSSSMDEGEKLPRLKEGAKLAIALLDGDLTVIAFCDHAHQSKQVTLSDPDSRRLAMEFIDSLGTGGGTNYLAAINALAAMPKGTVTLFASDGENNTGSDAKVLAAVRRAPGPIYTVGVETTKKAQQLLNKMAATSGGAAVHLDSAQKLTEHLLKLAQSFGYYRSHRRSWRFRGHMAM